MTGDRSLHEQTYRALLRLYPVRFRARFGDEMVQLFGDLLRDAHAVGRPAAPIRLWLHTLWDLAVTAPSEHGRERTVAHSLSRPPTHTMRALGILGILGGAFILSAWVPNLPWTHELFNLRVVVFNVGVIAIVVAVHRRQAVVARTLSLAVTVPAVIANAWYAVMIVLSLERPRFPEPDPEFRQVFFWVAIALWLTDAAFGFVAWRIGAVSRVGALFVAVGSLMSMTGVGGLGLTTGPIAPLIVQISPFGVAVLGVGWVLLGLDVARHRRPIGTVEPNTQ
jgi:hypothetical protein